MAYTSIIPVHRLDNSINYIKDKEKTTKPAASAGSLEEAIDYALNRDKTETMAFEDAIGCTCEDAFADMLATKRRFHKVDGVQGYHLIQSFAAGEVSPELAHLIGLELAEQLLKGKYEVVVTTHLNTSHCPEVGILCIALEGKEVSEMAQYVVDMQTEKQEKFYFIREKESMDIVLLPSKYLMHKKRSKISPNTIRRSAFALSYYLNYMDENQLHLDDIYKMKYAEQHEHFTDFLIWLKAGEHSREEYSKLPNNETCNAYLKEVFRFYTFMERENGQSESLKVLSDAQMIVRNSVGVRRVLNRKSFHGYLKEKGHQGKTIEQDKIVSLLQKCANCRDQVLLLLLAETGFRIGELLGVRYREDIDYKNHVIYVNFREDNENNARAKNAEFRRAKISDATFDILMFYMEDYKELLREQKYLFINVSSDYAGEPFKVSGVYAMLRRLEEKTGIKASPHMLRHYFANERRKDGWKLELISQALGHRNIETTMKYLNITDEELIQVSDEFYSKHQAMYGIQDLL